MLPLIHINVGINDLLAKGLYDPGSNVSVLMCHALRRLNINYNKKKFSYRTMSGSSNFVGVANIKLQIFNITKSVQVYVVDNSSRDHDILLGLDIISLFKLRQDEHLRVSQASVTERGEDGSCCILYQRKETAKRKI